MVQASRLCWFWTFVTMACARTTKKLLSDHSLMSAFAHSSHLWLTTVFFFLSLLFFSLLYFRRSSRASLLPDDSVPASDRLPGRQPAVSVHGLVRGRGHAGSVVSGREDGGTWCRSGHLHREKHGAELLFNSQVIEASREGDTKPKTHCRMAFLHTRYAWITLWAVFALERDDTYTWNINSHLIYHHCAGKYQNLKKPCIVLKGRKM